MNPTTATVLAASIPAAITATFAFAGVVWQNRKTRAKVEPISNGFAAGVKDKLQLIVDTQELHGKQLDFLSEKVDDHLSDHKHGRVVPIRKRVS